MAPRRLLCVSIASLIMCVSVTPVTSFMNATLLPTQNICSGRSSLATVKYDVPIYSNFTMTCRLNSPAYSTSQMYFFITARNIDMITSQVDNVTLGLVIANFTFRLNATVYCYLGELKHICIRQSISVKDALFPGKPKVQVFRALFNSDLEIRWIWPNKTDMDRKHLRVRYKLQCLSDASYFYKKLNKQCEAYVSKRVTPCSTGTGDAYPCECPDYRPDTMTCVVARSCLTCHLYEFIIVSAMVVNNEVIVKNMTYQVKNDHKYYAIRSIDITVLHTEATTVHLKLIASLCHLCNVTCDIWTRTTDRNAPSMMRKIPHTFDVKKKLIVLKDLQPFTLYDVSLRAKYGGSEYWTRTLSLQFKTNEAPPSAGPVLTNQSFWFSRVRDETVMTVYWEKIPEHHARGYITSYDVVLYTASSDTCIKLPSSSYQLDHNFTATNHTIIHPCVTVRVRRNTAFRVEVRGRNVEGWSPISTIYVQPRSCYVLLAVHNVTVEEQTHVHNSSWAGVVIRWNPTDTKFYRIHYCISTDPKAFVCENDYRSILVQNTSDTELHLIIPTPRKYIIGVSSLYSGITWASCLSDSQGDPDAPESMEVVSKDAGVLHISWQGLTCLQSRGILYKYEVTYLTKSSQFSDSTASAFCDEGVAHQVNPLVHLYDAQEVSTSMQYLVCVRGVTREGPGVWRYKVTTTPILMTSEKIAIGFAVLVLLVFIIVTWCYCRIKKHSKFKLPFSEPADMIEPYFPTSYGGQHESYDEVPKREKDNTSCNSQTQLFHEIKQIPNHELNHMQAPNHTNVSPVSSNNKSRESVSHTLSKKSLIDGLGINSTYPDSGYQGNQSYDTESGRKGSNGASISQDIRMDEFHSKPLQLVSDRVNSVKGRAHEALNMKQLHGVNGSQRNVTKSTNGLTTSDSDLPSVVYLANNSSHSCLPSERHDSMLDTEQYDLSANVNPISSADISLDDDQPMDDDDDCSTGDRDWYIHADSTETLCASVLHTNPIFDDKPVHESSDVEEYSVLAPADSSLGHLDSTLGHLDSSLSHLDV